MLKRILLLLGETPSSASARTYGFALAQRSGAGLSGLAGIDVSSIEALMPGVAGGMAWKATAEDRLRQQAAASSRRLHALFREECAAHQMAFDWLSFEGDALQCLQLAAETRDLVVTGHDTAFHGSVRERLPEVLARLLAMTPRPVVVCPDELPNGSDILIAYDGSVPSMRVVQLFSLLGLGQGRRIHVTSIDRSQDVAARRASGAASYLRNHGHEVEASPIASCVSVPDVLRIEIADRKIGTLVMGAFGHRGLREYLFGSKTHALVEDPRCALFIYH
jgi:nucleotide-binding universal stress UspA family protein